MRIRVLVAVAICLVAVAAVGPAQYADEPLLTLYGQVRVARSLDGLSTAITVDVVSTDRPPDGLVEHAFRVQHKFSGPLAYDGLSTVTFREHSLIISVDDAHGWIFTLDSSTPPPDQRAPAYTCQLAYGLSHFWGDTVHGAADDIGARLLRRSCTSDDSDPSCENCADGGRGMSTCSITCNESEQCSAKCADGFFACCKCPAECGCCAVITTAPSDEHQVRRRSTVASSRGTPGP